MEIDSILNKIVENLKPADPYKIVLFGSHAKGTATKDSDIDLMVILDNDFVSKNCREFLRRNCKVRKLVDHVCPIDLIIYSKAEYERSKKRDSFLVYEVERTGRPIYEKYN
ncbi:MAG: nucleotidyltransferase domain-containing protein [Endomicrobium sp.]|jgi:predicted nucleotidyltransferase|nr:nucleotidyltransferase domain-containing protein [Endomicrobium sp.]